MSDTDLTQYKIKDTYTGKLVRARDTEELAEWLSKSYATLTAGQREMIANLIQSFEDDDKYKIKWYGVACDLNIERKKKRK